MPHSDERLRPWVRGELDRLACLSSITSVVDVGAGAGTWRDFLAPDVAVGASWTAIEVWEPYVGMYGLDQRYDRLIVADARDITLPEAELYIFGDVLEHMPAQDAMALWDRARLVSSWLVINLPVRRYEQGALMGNPHEVHVCHWDMESVLDRFGGIVSSNEGEPPSVVGAFIGRGCA